MQTGLQVTSGGNLTVLSTRDNAAHHMIVNYGNPMLDAVDYSDPIAVEAARTTILQMPVWEHSLGWVFRDGCEPEGRAALVQTVLCQRAAIWRQENVGRTAAMELGEDVLVNAQAKLFSLLSPRGCEFMTCKYHGEPGGICYTPKTGDAEVDELLCMVVSEEAISALRELGPGTNEIADTLEKHAQTWNSAEQSRESATRWEELAMDQCEENNFDIAAVALRNAAAAWKAGDRPLNAAMAYDEAATNWHKAMETWEADYYERAGQSSEDAAALWESTHWLEQAATAYRAAAVSWTVKERHSRAAQAHEMAAKALLRAGGVEAAAKEWGLAARSWVDAGRHDKALCAGQQQALYFGRAAELCQRNGESDIASRIWRAQATAWETAGYPDQAAQSWKAALLAAGTAPVDVSDAIAGGTSLLDFALGNEETLQG